MWPQTDMDEVERKRRLSMVAIFLLCLLMFTGLLIAVFPHNKSQTRLVDKQQAALASSAYADPILQYLPYGDIGYKITPEMKTIDAKTSLVIQITVTFSGADYRSSPAEQASLIQQREQQALNYIRSKGLDPAKYRYEYVTPLD